MVTRLNKDDGYRGLVRNPTTGQVLFAGKELSRDPFYERVDSAEGHEPIVQTSKPVRLVEEIVDNSKSAVPEVTATPEATAQTATDDAGLALATLLAEAHACTDKGKIKEIGESIGVKLTMNMNLDTMRERISTQAQAIQSASSGA